MTTTDKAKQLIELAKKATPRDRGLERLDWDNGDISYEMNNKNGFFAIRESHYKHPMKAKFDAEFIAASNPATVAEIAEAYLEAIKKLEMYERK